MEPLSIDQTISLKRETILEISLNSVNRNSVLDAKIIKPQLIALVSKNGTTVRLNLKGLKFIDNTVFDCLNLVSRVARRYQSALKLQNIEPELKELIDLVKEHSVFDVKY